MRSVKAMFAFLIILPSVGLAQNAPSDKPNTCNDVHWTKKWQCETDRLQADENRRRAGVGEEQMKLACQRLSLWGEVLLFKNEAGRVPFISGKSSGIPTWTRSVPTLPT